jgi:hypothetical protein
MGASTVFWVFVGFGCCGSLWVFLGSFCGLVGLFLCIQTTCVLKCALCFFNKIFLLIKLKKKKKKESLGKMEHESWLCLLMCFGGVLFAFDSNA